LPTLATRCCRKSVNSDKTNGLYVNSLVTGGGAEQAGIKTGDIITKVEGNPVYESSDLQERVGRLQPGDKINLTVLRDGGEKNLTVTLKADCTCTTHCSGFKISYRVVQQIGRKLPAVKCRAKS
jgi:serine protease Do